MAGSVMLQYPSVNAQVASDHVFAALATATATSSGEKADKIGAGSGMIHLVLSGS
jgi:hypothetical protein